MHKYISLFVKIGLEEKYRVMGNRRKWCKKVREVGAHRERWWDLNGRRGDGEERVNSKDI